MNFSELKAKFDEENKNTVEYECFLPVHLTHNKKLPSKNLIIQAMKSFINGSFYTHW
ncbi:hypothetical protein L4F91_05605 [Avibacterium sp. 20-126]|uniref:hypothetical protein n=1 Tax=Avibacterium sp. 20-126 TaxID=2911524 RepID=UPI0021848B60|nr:hypothetical protein L4F91_05605 [Avibacterium sp. 20-126]